MKYFKNVGEIKKYQIKFSWLPINFSLYQRLFYFILIIIKNVIPNFTRNCVMKCNDLSLHSSAIHPPRVFCLISEMHSPLLTPHIEVFLPPTDKTYCLFNNYKKFLFIYLQFIILHNINEYKHIIYIFIICIIFI